MTPGRHGGGLIRAAASLGGSEHRSSSTRSAPAGTLVIGTGGVVAPLLTVRRHTRAYLKAPGSLSKSE